MWQFVLYCAFVISFGYSQLILAQEALPFELVEDQDTLMAYHAALSAEAELEGVPYAWYGTNLAHCSGFVSRYLSHLGYSVELDLESPYRYEPDEGGPVPASSTHMQVARFQLLDEEVGGGFTNTTTVIQLLEADWKELGVKPGSLVYWTKAEAQIEYNGWAHVTIVLGYTHEGEPVLADFANGMKNGPVLGRSLRQVANGLYFRNDLQRWDLTPYGGLSQPPLRAFIVDTLGLYQASVEAEIFGGNND